MTDAHEKELKIMKEKLADIQRKICETEDIEKKEEYQFMIDKIEKDIAEEMESYKYLSQRWKIVTCVLRSVFFVALSILMIIMITLLIIIPSLV